MKKILLIVSIFLFSNFLNAEIVKNIIIEGNDRISDETIKVYGEVKINDNIDEIKVNEIIKNLYSTNFFEDIKVSLKNQTLFINLKEYPVINEIIISGEKAKKYREAILERIESKKNGPFIKSSIVQDEKLIKRLYSSLGFNFLKVNSKFEEFDNKRVNLYFEIEKGEKTNISKINFKGDKKIRDRRLRDVITSQEDKFWKFLNKNTKVNQANINLDKRLLTNYYKSIGYYDVKVLSEIVELKDNFQAEITYNIDAGTRYRINKITTDIDPVLNKELFLPLKKIYNEVIGNYYSPFLVKTLLDDLDLIINNEDLQFVEHNVNEILEGDTIEIVINIFEGPKVLVESIEIFGNTVTEETVIRSELLLDEGDPFSKVKVDKSIAELKSRRIFGSVKEEISDGSIPNTKKIKISVEEMPTGEISAGAGIGTNGGSFGFNIKENNWLGKGVTLSANADVSEDSIKGELSFTDKDYNFTGKELTYSVYNTITDKKEDSGYESKLLGAGVGIAYEKYRDIYFSPGFSFNIDDLTTDESASSLLKRQAGSSTDLMFNYSVFTDKRDRSFMPTKGNITSFSQSIPIYAEDSYLRNSFSTSHYKEFSEDIIGALKFSASAINGLKGDDVRVSKRSFLSSRKLRGFKAGKVGPKDGEDYIGGNYTTALNLEANFPNFFPEKSNAELGLFFDAGNVWGVDYSDALDDSNEIRSTLGFNLSWISPAGPMTFVISNNVSKASTDQDESFNFRLGTTF